ncbi:DUF6934 family protein [Pedobacter sp. N23S346]|uniref:DUF6934 family protein n=1 Tax=Pedobacter sp. N23S346 TaxID=3402750 RepID=UPI003AC2A210
MNKTIDVMLLDQYEYFAKNNFLTYQFTSEGVKGSVEKIVQYSKLTIPGVGIVYNLGFGDLSEDGNISDITNSNNGDMEKVLATVANTVYDFIENYPNQLVFAHGSTTIRTKLYQRKLIVIFVYNRKGEMICLLQLRKVTKA